MNEKEITQLIKNQSLCRIAFGGDSYPYVAPFQYVAINDILYFHFTDYGKKINFLKRDNPVCVEIETYTPDLSKFAFVILQGKLKRVDNSSEKNIALNKFADEGKKKFSEKFLEAHGLSIGSKWEDLTNKPVVIVKLDKVLKRTGLKSDNYAN